MNPCPRCGYPTRVYHCNSFYCRWFICTKCTGYNAALLFDRKQRYFLLEGKK